MSAAHLSVIGLMVTFSSSFAQENLPDTNWECRDWFGEHYTLYCGGASIAQYPSGLACLKAKKQICGISSHNYECRDWFGEHFTLFCSGVRIDQYKTSVDCVRAKRSLCD